MTLYSGGLLVFENIVLIKNIQAPPAYTRTFYNIVPATTNLFNCVWADVGGSQTKEKVYFSTSNGIFVIDLSGKSLYQHISPTENNITGEVLVQADVVDLNVAH